VVERNADRLLALANDLLFMAQLEAGKLVLELGETALAPLAEECAQAARSLAEDREIALTVHTSATPVLAVDRPRLAQVLANLLSNALKFTPPGGSVELRIGGNGHAVQLEVSDTGMGISTADQLRSRPSSAPRRRNATAIPGTGLGLAISKGIAEAHRGRISVESKEGRGTTFRIELPSAPAALADRPSAAAAL
jgi:two-component system, OmpR family, phosphate regulon sensor histidine kinase PhoR